MVCCLLVAWDSTSTDILGWKAVTLNASVDETVVLDSNQGNADGQQPAASILSNVLHPQTESVWISMGRNFRLNHYTQYAQVQREIRRLVANQGQLYHILASSTPYIYYIYKQTQKQGLPAELALIPVIESEFNPNDRSNKGALGLWQIMPQTAHELGVKDHSGYDGRRNVVASTDAALAYFKDLGINFNNNWYLAIAAYNCGQGKVESVERRTGNHSFWGMPLPRDTRYYVPRLLAVAEIVKNPKKYGVELPPVNNQPYFSEIKVSKPVNLTTIAKKSGINIDTLHKLNPDYKHGVKPKKGTYSLLVPTSKTPSVKAQLAGKVVTVKSVS